MQLYTSSEAINFKERATSFEFSKPVNIGKDVWIGGGAIVCY